MSVPSRSLVQPAEAVRVLPERRLVAAARRTAACALLLVPVCGALAADPLAIPPSTFPPPAADAPPRAAAAAAALPVSAPRIQFAETRHNFGRILHGDSVRHDFIFTNTGTATLEITAVRPGCGCTTAGEWDRSVEPGKTGRIPLLLRSTGFNGPIGKTATVSTTDPTQPNVVLMLQGEVWNPITISPQTAMFQYDRDSTNIETRIVRITSNMDSPLELGEPQWTNSAFTATLKPVLPGREYELHVSLDPSKASGVASTPIFVRSPSTNAPEVRVQAYALERQPILISPAQVVLPAGPLPAARRVTVLVRANANDSLSLSNASISLPDIPVEVRMVQPGRVYSITADFPPGFEMKSGVTAAITADSNNPRVPKVRIPVIQSPAPPAQAAPAAATATVRPKVRPLSPKPAPLKDLNPPPLPDPGSDR